MVNKLFIKIITYSVILIYLGGLANYQIVSFLHYAHHFFEHTLGKHHHHPQNNISYHGHSHNSFIDYSLYIEEVENKTESKKDAIPISVKTDYLSHIISNKLGSDCLLCCSEIQYHKHCNFLTDRLEKPPYPPPRSINYV